MAKHRSRRKIRWAKSSLEECDYQWPAKEGETIELEEELEGVPTVVSIPARGPHRCVKDAGHEADPTNDDHQCCCGNTTEEITDEPYC